MPRSINLETMRWKKDGQEYGTNEFGVGKEEFSGSDFLGSFLRGYEDGKGQQGISPAIKNCGEFMRTMTDEDEDGKAPSAARNAKADKIFHWAEENLSGKWHLAERFFGLHFNGAVCSYIIEDKADREKFQQQWGDAFKYTEPTAAEPVPYLTQFEAAHEERTKSALQKAWDKSNAVLPLYKGEPEIWMFTAVRIEGKDHLFAIPEDERKNVEEKYGVKIETDKVKQLGGILDGKVDFEAGPEFYQMVQKMLHGYGEDMFRSREVDGYRFALVSGEGDARKSYNGKEDTLESFRETYKQGQDVSFAMKGTSFTFNVNNPLVTYTEMDNGGTAVSGYRGGMERAERREGVTGFYDKKTGLPEGEWKHTHFVGGWKPSAKETSAVYKDGHLVSGTLQIHGDNHYQPPKPEVTVVGQKKPAM